ncbi:MopE-related protein [Patescibacteria group bacterium]
MSKKRMWITIGIVIIAIGISSVFFVRNIKSAVDCCHHECSLSDPPKCEGNVPQVCGSCDSDYYNDWCPQTNCSVIGKTCINGTCEVCIDNDGDGYGDPASLSCAHSQKDCDDTKKFINPSAVENCDNRDNNCNSQIDEGCDDDNDNYCDNTKRIYNAPTLICPNTIVSSGSLGNDCNDNNADSYPGNTEICGNGLDDDCNGSDLICPLDCKDSDGDGFGVCPNCGINYGCSNNGNDCNDGDDKSHIGAVEICDGKDNDCDLDIDEGCDLDGDNYCDCSQEFEYGSNLMSTCIRTNTTNGEAVANTCDCDETNKNIHPSASEICENGIDEDCDKSDSICALNCVDNDNDGYGNPASDSCIHTQLDCNDSDSKIHPWAIEICDGKDNDCDGTIDEWCDIDGDNYCDCSQEFEYGSDLTSTCSGTNTTNASSVSNTCDCNEINPNIHPSASEICGNGVDEDCDGIVDEGCDLGEGNIYYIDSNLGNDGWEGTEVKPWKTIAKVNSMSFNPGDNILFKRGEIWKEQLTVSSSGESGNRITYGAYGVGENPIIDGEKKRNFGIFSKDKTYLNIQDITIYNTLKRGIYLTNTGNNGSLPGFITVDSCVIHDVGGGIPVINNVGIYFYGTNIKITDSTVYNIEGDGIYARGHNTTITGCHIFNVSTGDLGDCLQISTYTDNFYVANNILDHSSESDKNVFALTSGETSGKGGIFENNICIMPYGGGGLANVLYMTQSEGVIIRNNYLEGGHIGMWLVAGTAHNNIITGPTHRGIRAGTVSSVNLYNNVIEGGSTGSGIFLNTNYKFIVKNNIITNFENGIIMWNNNNPLTEYDYNILYNNGQNYRGATKGVHSLEIDPLFVDVANKDFHLQLGSPAINAGLNVGFTKDFEGNSIVGNPDIGAFEYSGLPSAEICDGKDNDGDGQKDEGCDVDGDKYCDCNQTFTYGSNLRSTCLFTNTHDASAVANTCDCDESDDNINHGASEICGNGVDEDCDGIVDEGCDLGEGNIYYIDCNGNNSNNGLFPGTAWKTIGKANSFSFSDGDTVRLKRGCVFDDATFRSPGVDDFTLEDYGTGAKPHFDGDVKRPIRIEDSTISNLTIRNIDISGQDFSLTKSSNIFVRYVNGVTIEGIFGDGHRGGNLPNQRGKSAITVRQCAGAIVVRNCELYNWGPDDLPSIGSDFMGISMFENESGTYEVYNNIVHHVNADCLYLGGNTAEGYVHDNVFYNGGENCIDVKSTSNVEIYNNEFYLEEGYGKGGSGNSPHVLIVMHARTEEFPGKSAENNIVRDNYFHDAQERVIELSGGSGNGRNNKVYNNIMENCDGNITIGARMVDTFIHHNLFINPNSIAISENNANEGTKIYNNVIYDESGYSDNLYSIYIDTCDGTEIKNNIVFSNNSNSNAFLFYNLRSSSNAVVENNLWYNPNNANRIKWGSNTYSVADLNSWKNAGHAGALFEDNPIFVDAENGDFHIQVSSPAINAGVNVGLTEDFDGNAIVGNPDIGAYEYSGASSAEICDGKDNDHDGNVDEGCDVDGDKYCDCNQTFEYGSDLRSTCLFTNTHDASAVANTCDCDESDDNINHGASEICGNGVDEDCSGADLACSAVNYWYVRPSGGNYNAENGTNYNNAWDGFIGSNRINWSQIQPGDTLYICGTHSDQSLFVGASGTVGKQIKISGDCTTDLGNPDPGSITSSPWSGILIRDKSYIAVSDITIYDTQESGLVVDTFNGTGDITGITIERVISHSNLRGDNSNGIWLATYPTEYKIHDVIIKDCETYNNGGCGYRIGGYIEDVIVKDCLSHHDSQIGPMWGFLVQGAHTISANVDWDHHSGSVYVIEDGILRSTGEHIDGVFAINLPYMWLNEENGGVGSLNAGEYYYDAANNKLYVHLGGTDPDAPGYGVMLTHRFPKNVNFIGCVAHHTANPTGAEGHGMGFELSARDCGFYNCISYENGNSNGGSGFAAMFNDNCIVANCISYGNNGVGFGGQKNSGLKHYNNVAYDNTHGFFFFDYTTVEVKNCISHSNTNRGLSSGWGAKSVKVVADNDYNILYNNGVNYFGSGSQGANSINTNPLFVNPASHDFHLQSTSPAINAGVNVGLTEDFDGNAIVGNPDIGAYEYSP